jgi:hypothetical protein
MPLAELFHASPSEGEHEGKHIREADKPGVQESG